MGIAVELATALAMTTVGVTEMAIVDAIAAGIAIEMETGIEMDIIAATIGIATAITAPIYIAAKSFIVTRALTCTRTTAAIVTALTHTSAAIRTACTPGQTMRAAGKVTIRNAHTSTEMAAVGSSPFSAAGTRTAWLIATVF